MLPRPHLATNMLIETIPPDGGDPIVERIVWISADHTFCYAIDMDGPGKLKKCQCAEIYDDIAEGIRIILTEDHYAPSYMILETDLSDSQRKYIQSVWPEIRKIVDAGEVAFDKIKLARLLAQSSEGKKKLRRALLAYWRSGQMRSAIPPRYDRRGGVGKRRRNSPSSSKAAPPRFCSVTPDVLALMQRGYNEFYVKGRATSVRHAWQETIEKYFNNGFDIQSDGVKKPILKPVNEYPSYKQFLRHCHYRRDRERVLQRRHGRAHTALNHDPRLGSVNQMCFGPGSVAYTDSTLAGVTLVSSLNRSRVIGKATIHFLIDGFSQGPMGYSISLEAPSWITQMMTVVNAVTDKVSYCRQFGIEIEPADWPCQHLPKMIIGDRGELISQHASNLINTLNVDVSNNPPYMPVMKGPVELAFNLLDVYALKNLPGGGQRLRRPQPDTRGTPCLTLYELHQIVIHHILTYLKGHVLLEYAPDSDMIADGVEHTPLKLWEWGIQNRSGVLRTASPQTVYAALLPRETASITPQGIRFKGRRYQVVSDRLKGDERKWFFETREKRKPIAVAYDPRTSSYIYLCLPGNQLVRCELLAREEAFANREWSEIADYEQFLLGQRREMDHRWRQLLANFHAEVNAIVEPAKSMAQQQREIDGISKNAVEANVRVYRAMEKVLERVRDLSVLERYFAPSDTQPPTVQVSATNKIHTAGFELEILTAFLRHFEEGETGNEA
jgi:putative transposase